MNDIERFCRYHTACLAGRVWALENCKDMQEAWDMAKTDWVVWMATRPGVLSAEDIKRALAHLTGWLRPLLRDKRSVRALNRVQQLAAAPSMIMSSQTLAPCWAEAVAAAAEGARESTFRSDAESVAAVMAAVAIDPRTREDQLAQVYHGVFSIVHDRAEREAKQAKFVAFLREDTTPCFTVPDAGAWEQFL